ncbi:hypothetical protein [Burkholderia cepacia]|uniref:hypothetical protein n=1 Tax=Burkholderia cepacia TaxID=292 RepID=UPI0012D8A9BC|nr:hypothetical protein [Burkholderia cepacia]
MEYFVVHFVVGGYHGDHVTCTSVAMPLIAEEEVRKVVLPYFADFQHIYASAWKDWLASPVASRMQHKRVRANLMWNQLISHAKVRFDGHPSVRVETLRNWDGVLIDNRIFIRMKKAEESLLSRNYPTQAALAFHDQIQDLFGGIARLELLYVLSKDETEIEQIVLVQRHKKQILWRIDVHGESGTDTQTVMPFAPLPTTDGLAVAERVIKPKTDGSRKDGTQDRAAAGGDIPT